MALDIVQKAWTAPTRGPVTGEVAILDVDSLTGLRAALPALRGKIVLVLSGPKAGSAERQDMARYQRDVNAALAQAGLAGVLLIAGRDEVPDMWGGPGSRFDRQGLSIITLRSAAVLQRLLARGIRPRLRLELTGGFAPRPQLAHNVVADFKGTEPGAHVIIGAHLDSWDLSCGAADNASGVVAALEVLRAMHSSGLTPRRSLRVVLFSGEEQGLLGSRAYVGGPSGRAGRYPGGAGARWRRRAHSGLPRHAGRRLVRAAGGGRRAGQARGRTGYRLRDRPRFGP
ncbi:M20/M25/M40 family metallo-hydrolase [Massilia sp. H-1]|nr:M20/M25/M40 family metallo-hydrolase [Massilia sp. H-1]